MLAAYLLRGIGDAAGTPADDLLHVTPAWPSWLSPIGYGQFTGRLRRERPAAAARAARRSRPLVIGAVFALQSVRDQGASLLAGRAGRATAGPVLSSSFGLAWRLNISILLSWTAGGIATGLLATSLSSIVGDVAGSNPQVIEILRRAIGDEASIEQAFVATFYGVVGILAACCAVQVGIRARQEEAHGTAELVLAHPRAAHALAARVLDRRRDRDRRRARRGGHRGRARRRPRVETPRRSSRTCSKRRRRSCPRASSSSD